MPIERALPSMIRIADSIVVGVQILHLRLGDLLDLLARVTVTHLVAVRVRRIPSATPAALASSTEAGGVLVMKL